MQRQQSTQAQRPPGELCFLSSVHGNIDDVDLERRRRLRHFLMECRSRLVPGDLGLPHTKRRRVQGLRRGEVAELVGVTEDWYRSFESGRAVRVSPQFVARLSTVLRLTVEQRLFIFRLAIPELYVIEDPFSSRGGFDLLPAPTGTRDDAAV